MISMREKWREQLLVTVLVVGGITLTFFPIVYFWQGRYVVAVVEAVCGSVLWLALATVKIKHIYAWPARIGWAGVVLALIVLLFTGGLDGTGLLWWSMLPVTSFVLFQKKNGLRAVILGLVMVSAVEMMRALGLLEVYFDTNKVVMMMALVGVVTAIMYNYEKISGQARDESWMKADLLEEKMAEEDRMKSELKSNLEKLGIEKEKQQKVRSAMINLLEDAKELEGQLEVEKKGVEKKVEIRTKELTETNTRFQSAIDSTPRIFVVLDVQKNIVVLNNKLESILGVNEKNWTLEKIDNLLGDKIDLVGGVTEVIETRKVFHMRDFEYGAKILSLYISPLTLDTAGEIFGVLMTIDDITEKVILERSKDEFFSIASHELRTPLTAIRGNTSMILEYYADALKDPELKSMVDDVHDSSIRLINIVNDFLNVSRLEQSKMVFDIKPFDIDVLIPEVIKEYDVTGSRQKVKISYTHSKPLPPLVFGDSDKVRQVLINLVGNALKFTHEGEINIYTEGVAKMVKVFVSDTGEGIPLKQQSLLFHKFQQAGSSLFTRDTAGGSGLGLYISRMMMEGMKGSIFLEKSEEGKGTVFSISLPISIREKKI